MNVVLDWKVVLRWSRRWQIGAFAGAGLESFLKSTGGGLELVFFEYLEKNL